MQRNAESMSHRVLISGLGGGLDVVNASILGFALRKNISRVIGSVRPAPQTRLNKHTPFAGEIYFMH
jgi:hypothetical protein